MTYEQEIWNVIWEIKSQPAPSVVYDQQLYYTGENDPVTEDNLPSNQTNTQMLDIFIIPRNGATLLHSPVQYRRCCQLSPLSGTEDWPLVVFPYIVLLGPWGPLNFHFITNNGGYTL